jgi:hypothetical protein
VILADIFVVGLDTQMNVQSDEMHQWKNLSLSSQS